MRISASETLDRGARGDVGVAARVGWRSARRGRSAAARFMPRDARSDTGRSRPYLSGVAASRPWRQNRRTVRSSAAGSSCWASLAGRSPASRDAMAMAPARALPPRAPRRARRHPPWRCWRPARGSAPSRARRSRAAPGGRPRTTGNAPPRERRAKSQAVEHGQPVGLKQDGRPHRARLGDALEQRHPRAGAGQQQRSRGAADGAAGDDGVHVGQLHLVSLKVRRSGRERRPATARTFLGTRAPAAGGRRSRGRPPGARRASPRRADRLRPVP